LDRQKDHDAYIEAVKKNAKEIREKVLKYLMVRRTRSEIIEYFSDDITQQGLKFPEVEKPVPFLYELNEKEDEIFMQTIMLITKSFKYARYTPMLYFQGKVTHLEQQAQRNMGKFMKILLVKRLESSFFAFRNSIDRFIHSYEMFIREFDNGNVYVSTKHASKIFELLENDDDEAIQRLIDEGKAIQYNSSDFKSNFREELQADYETLKKIKESWKQIERDPKLLKFRQELKRDSGLQKNHLIIFTESKETAEYLYKHLSMDYPEKVLCYTGGSTEAVRNKVIENFDARARYPKNDYRILISTEVLSEGVNLHRSNTVINYDIPWNPTRMMQRVGRINRVDTPFDKIYTYNFFPTAQSNSQIKLKEAAEAKINAFLTLLGGDAELLTEGEPIGSHELFDRLISKQSVEGETDLENSELKYLQAIRLIRDKNPALFESIKRLPKKARSSKLKVEKANSLLTYFRRGKIQKFFLSNVDTDAEELDFIATARLLECMPEESRKKLSEGFYDLLDKNKESFLKATAEEKPAEARRGRDSATLVLRILKATRKNMQMLTDDQELYLNKVIAKIEEGSLPKQTAKQTLKALNDLGKELVNPLKVVAVLQMYIPTRLLEEHYAVENPETFGKREVILSMYMSGA